MSDTLREVLDAREARWRDRLDLAGSTGLSVLSCTLRLPHSLRLSREAEEKARLLWAEAIRVLGGATRKNLFRTGPDGPEGLAAVDLPALELKRLAARLETGHPLGWMADLDVMDSAGEQIDRSALAESDLAAPRPCVVCGEPAKECIAMRKHSPEEAFEAARQRLTGDGRSESFASGDLA